MTLSVLYKYGLHAIKFNNIIGNQFLHTIYKMKWITTQDIPSLHCIIQPKNTKLIKIQRDILLLSSSALFPTSFLTFNSLKSVEKLIKNK